MTLHTGRFSALALAAFILMLVSCEADVPSHALSENGKGRVMLSLNTDLEIQIKSETESVAIEDYDDYNFRYVGVDGYATSDYYRYGDVTWPMNWYFGVFRLQAESCTAAEAEEGYGILRYEGISDPFSVINDQLAQTTVRCTVANFRVNVTFNDKMFQAYPDFYLKVTSVVAPVYEEDENGEMLEVSEEQEKRILDFTPLVKTGYFNVHSGVVNLKYELYVKMQGAEIHMLQAEGYLSDETGANSIVKPGDDIVFNVRYDGELPVTEGVKFVVEGETTPMNTGLELNDYLEGSVKEDE